MSSLVSTLALLNTLAAAPLVPGAGAKAEGPAPDVALPEVTVLC